MLSFSPYVRAPIYDNEGTYSGEMIMFKLTTFAVSTALILSLGSTTIYAQDVTDVAKDKAVDLVKDKAVDTVMSSDMAQDVVKEKAKEEAKAAIFGGEARSTTDIVKDKAMDMAKDKAEDVMGTSGTNVGGKVSETAMDRAKSAVMGSADEKSMTEMAKDKAMDMANDTVKTMKKKPMTSEDSSETGTAASASVTVACPEGTTARPDGTCMITGDWDAGE